MLRLNPSALRIRQAVAARMTAHMSSKQFGTSVALQDSESSMMFEEVGQAGVATMNRPKVLNSLNLDMVVEMKKQFDEWEGDAQKKVIVLQGAGGKAFCAGGDVVHIAKAGLAGDRTVAHEFFSTEYKLNSLIGRLRTPFVALIDGITMGGGVGVSVHGRYRVATEKTLFAMPETAIGLVPDVGGGHFLPRLKGELGMYLALTGNRLKAADVYHAGLATHYVPKDQLTDLTADLVSVENEEDVEVVLNKYHVTPDTPFSLDAHLNDIDRCFAGDKAEDMLALLNDSGEWGRKNAKTIEKMSPTSVKVTIRQLRNGAGLSLDGDLQMELRICAETMRNKDFYEGIRALLIEKTNDPKWTPATLAEVTKEMVDKHFVMLPAELELKIE
ncbi:hypothetical protein SARC_07921 [Sphaeroforma arctica JP610]|uniref:3-hydroxyisobutyryl-CoA hydrolase n=1 Tax=Sphaeroforma arctica JP610 TaxID=667725 RepID=A0A0L0FSN4_9EUKA|nr:hypothetical protein SARC_07921 [Sphaeroforma arctica JP610]KNC79694.1 hypothetical protein SARC_07921 [Sphaeroforma arctica JP610]|eukprot:XP_014153596.1 hypothetical protein SARC_07921 [Sphaeroforma arctica JP610]